MRKSIRSELRMLREMVWHFCTIKKCYFCKEPLLETDKELEYGERMFPPVKTRLAIHHRNGDHSDNRSRNRRPAHSKCHKRYHIKLQHKKAGGKRLGATAPRLK